MAVIIKTPLLRSTSKKGYYEKPLIWRVIVNTVNFNGLLHMNLHFINFKFIEHLATVSFCLIWGEFTVLSQSQLAKSGGGVSERYSVSIFSVTYGAVSVRYKVFPTARSYYC